METKTAFEILGLEPTTTPEEIEERFRKLATERHPDRGGADDLMAELNQARLAALTALAHARAMVPIEGVRSAIELAVTRQEAQRQVDQRLASTREDFQSKTTGKLRQFRRMAGVFAAVAAAALFVGRELPSDFLHSTPTDPTGVVGLPFDEPSPIETPQIDALIEEGNRRISRLWLTAWLSVAGSAGLFAWLLTLRIENVEHRLRELDEQTGTKTLLYQFLQGILGVSMHERWTLVQLDGAVFRWEQERESPYASVVADIGSLRFSQYLMDRAQQLRLVAIHEEMSQDGLVEFYRVERTG